MKLYQNKILILYIIIVPIVEAQVAMLPQTYVDLTDEQALKDLQRTLDLLDEDDDVTDVWTNWNEWLNSIDEWENDLFRMYG